MNRACLLLLASVLGRIDAIPVKGMPGIPPPKPPAPPPLLSFDESSRTSQQFFRPFNSQQQGSPTTEPFATVQQLPTRQNQQFPGSQQFSSNQQSFAVNNQQQQGLASQQVRQPQLQVNAQPFTQQQPLTERQRNSPFAPNDQNTKQIINYSYRLQ